MGSCFSGGSVTYISKKTPNSKKQKDYLGCFGYLCKGKDNIDIDNKACTDIYYPQQKIQSTFIINHKDDELNTNINKLIEKYQDSFNIEKINYEQLYNLFLNYKFDFTKCNYIINDVRKKIENNKYYFLNKFPKINYMIEELPYFNSRRQNNFFNYIKNKNIIFILENLASLEIVEKYLMYITPSHKNDIPNNLTYYNILILSQYIEPFNETKIENTYKEYLYYFIEQDKMYDNFCGILINTKDIKSSLINNKTNNNAYFFINKYSNGDSNNFDINYLCKKDINEKDIYLNFIARFKIYYILNITIKNNVDDKKNKISKNITYNESKKNKINNDDNSLSLRQINIFFDDYLNFNDYFKSIKTELTTIIDELRNQIILNNCVLMQFNEIIDSSIINKIIFFISNRMTGLSFDNLFQYFKINFCPLNEKIINTKKDELEKFIVQ